MRMLSPPDRYRILRADYWKSMPRKFCEFCKCWLTDNKPSVEFHEKGKRHQENVKKKIDQIKKKSLEDAKKQEEMDSDMKKLEEAAMNAFKKDMMNDPGLAAQYGVKLKTTDEKEERKEVLEKQTAAERQQVEEVEWYEAVSDKGYHYYWNITTGKSVWEKPTRYRSLAEQRDQEAEAEATGNKDKAVAVEHKSPQILQSDESAESPSDSDDDPASEERKKLLTADHGSKSTADRKEEDNEGKEEAATGEGASREQVSSSRSTYGRWTTVEESAPVNLELPQFSAENVPLPDFSHEAHPKIKFKEKRVTCLGGDDNQLVGFKKRKLTSGARNTRRRDDDN